ncbi:MULTISPECIES: LysE family translocator [Kitasatospora]|uniref:LysE family translocator n=1 Tax=Kitasatospora TaxID=2063 RepID=UPI000C6FF57B|nr:LysE family translocator [Kitasatospora sp. GP30]MDH6138398.1 threonine/homoserine/homoserine lactone efflux protein [Kitasatospora sp. GP30]
MPLRAVAGFLAAVFPLIATPGASFTLLVQRVSGAGRRQGLLVAAGTATGLYVHATLAALGLSALVMRSSAAFTALRLAGAGYLIALGLWSWYRAGAQRTEAGREVGRAVGGTYRQAVLGNVLNPKAASIFLTLVPQFVDPHRPLPPQILLLATAQAALVCAWLLTWTVVVARAAAAFARGPARAALARVSAAVLVTLGLRAVVG